MAHDVFVSYSTKDKAIADAVCASLEAKKIRCWIAPRDVLPGISYAEALIDGLNRSRVLVLVFSSNSNSSPQVMREIERAVHKGISIIPFQIEDVVPTKAMEYFVSSSHWLDALTPPLEKNLQVLAATVETLLSTKSNAVPDEPAIQVEEKPLVSTVPVENTTPAPIKTTAEADVQSPLPTPNANPADSITLTPNVSGAICYFLGWLSGALFLALARGNRFILFHAWQSIITGGVATLVFILLALIPPVAANSIVFWVILLFEWIFALSVILLWVFLMIQAYRGCTTTIPLAGRLAWKLVDRTSSSPVN